MMTWVCQEFRTRGKRHDHKVHHQLRFPILTFQSKKLHEIADPGHDDDPSPGPDPTSEPIRVQKETETDLN